MGALSAIGALILCFLVVKITEWWDNRKEEKERQRKIEISQSVEVIQPYDTGATGTGFRWLMYEV